MLKIWAKIIKNDKIINTTVVEFDTNRISFFELVKSVCEKLDLATPVLLNKHYEDLRKFNLCTFTKNDFIEKINFDRLLIEKI